MQFFLQVTISNLRNHLYPVVSYHDDDNEYDNDYYNDNDHDYDYDDDYDNDNDNDYNYLSSESAED